MSETTIPSKFTTVTPSDTAPVNCEIGLHVGGAGNVTVKNRDGTTAVFAVAANTRLIGRFYMVMATGTTATAIVALD